MRPTQAADGIRKIHRFILPGGFLGGSPAAQRRRLMIGERSFFIITTGISFLSCFFSQRFVAPYSYRSATIGSTLAARRAGT